MLSGRGGGGGGWVAHPAGFLAHFPRIVAIGRPCAPAHDGEPGAVSVCWRRKNKVWSEEEYGEIGEEGI